MPAYTTTRTDHSHAELLKRKSLSLTADLPGGWQGTGLVKTLNQMIPKLLPVWKILDRAFPG